LSTGGRGSAVSSLFPVSALRRALLPVSADAVPPFRSVTKQMVLQARRFSERPYRRYGERRYPYRRTLFRLSVSALQRAPVPALRRAPIRLLEV